MSDPLAAWWRWEVTVTRLLGHGAYGDVWDTPTVHRCAIDDRTRLVRNPSGEQVLSETTVLLPADTPDIPPESLVVLPPRFGSREARVMTASRHDSGGMPTPDHLSIALT